MRKHEPKKYDRAQRMAHYEASDTNGKLIINLRDISHAMRALYEGKGSQKRILIVLNEVGNITQSALTERLGIQPGSASEVIAKLENAGLITRIPSETDRRTADIALTDSGKEYAAKAVGERSRRHEEMFSCLSDKEKAQLLTLLEKINTDWDERYSDAVNGSQHHEHHRPEREREE